MARRQTEEVKKFLRIGKRRLYEVRVMGVFVGHREGSDATIRKQVKDTYNTNAVRLKKVWEVERRGRDGSED